MDSENRGIIVQHGGRQAKISTTGLRDGSIFYTFDIGPSDIESWYFVDGEGNAIDDLDTLEEGGVYKLCLRYKRKSAHAVTAGEDFALNVDSSNDLSHRLRGGASGNFPASESFGNGFVVNSSVSVQPVAQHPSRDYKFFYHPSSNSPPPAPLQVKDLAPPLPVGTSSPPSSRPQKRPRTVAYELPNLAQTPLSSIPEPFQAPIGCQFRLIDNLPTTIIKNQIIRPYPTVVLVDSRTNKFPDPIPAEISQYAVDVQLIQENGDKQTSFPLSGNGRQFFMGNCRVTFDSLRTSVLSSKSGDSKFQLIFEITKKGSDALPLVLYSTPIKFVSKISKDTKLIIEKLIPDVVPASRPTEIAVLGFFRAGSALSARIIINSDDDLDSAVTIKCQHAGMGIYFISPALEISTTKTFQVFITDDTGTMSPEPRMLTFDVNLRPSTASQAANGSSNGSAKVSEAQNGSSMMHVDNGNSMPAPAVSQHS